MDGINKAQGTVAVATPPAATPGSPVSLNQVADRTLGARVSTSASTPTQVPQFANGNQVVQYGLQHLGKKVGNGECTTLADNALKKAGAQTTEQVDPPGPGETQAEYGKQDYKWGTQVPPDQAQPGDIMQFKDYENDTNSQTTTTNKDGSGRVDTRTSTETAGHHTAIVLSNDGNGKYTVLEQNAPTGSPVRKHQYTLQGGHVVTDGTGKNGATVHTETDTTVSGQVTFYRPTPK